MSINVQRDTVTIGGPDAAKFLQGQLSNDVAGLAVGASCWSFLLDPSGKLGFLLRARRNAEESFTLDAEFRSGDAVEARLRRFLIRTKATISTGHAIVDVSGTSDGVELVGWWGEGSHRSVADGSAPLAATPHVDALRIAAGWPGEGELTEGVIPGETGVVGVAVSFTKGCYTGQELVARIDSRGNNVPRHLSKVVLGGHASVGDDVFVDGEARGALTSVAGLNALAYIHRNVETPTECTVNGAPGEVLAQQVTGEPA
jgi:tRNA-modifying protein YgfZ